MAHRQTNEIDDLIFLYQYKNIAEKDGVRIYSNEQTTVRVAVETGDWTLADGTSGHGWNELDIALNR